MNLLMTGHTSSVGRALCEFYKDHEIVGISRSSNFDLTDPADIEKVIALSLDCDHFINLANVGHSQCDLLYGVYRLWQENNKPGKIISFGTLATAAPFSLLKRIPVDMFMLGHKLSLEKIHAELSIETPFGPQPQSVLIRFANYGMKTDKRSNEPYSTEKQMTEIVDFVLKSNTYISSLDFREI